MKKKSWLFSVILLSAIWHPGASLAFDTILDNTAPNHTVLSGSDERIYGTSSSNRITIGKGATAELLNFPGENTIQIQSDSDQFTVFRSGTFVTFQGTDGTVLTIPATADIQVLSFSDRTLTLSIYANQVMLDDQIITSVPLPIEFPAELLITQNIDGGGGTLAVDDFSLVIPQGLYNGAADLSLYRMGNSRDFETDMKTSTFRVTGLQDDFPDTLFPSLRYTGPLSEESFIVVGEEVFIPSRSIPGMGYQLIPAAGNADFLTASGPSAAALFSHSMNSKIGNSKTGAEIYHSATVGRFLDFSGITGWKTHVTRNGSGHFAIQYPVDTVTLSQASSLGQMLETAYDTFQAMGFSYANRTSWPVSVTLKKMGAEEYGYHCPSVWGHNRATLQFNRDKLNETEEMATTAGHEFFHLVQYLYDPRNAVSRAKFSPVHHWLNEACAVWAEEKFSSAPGYESAIRDGHKTTPFNGIHAPAVTGNAGHHGYGMSAFIKFLVNEFGEAVVRDIYLKIFDGVHPVEAINMVTSYQLSILWEQFLRDYVTGSIYGFERASALSILSGMFRVQTEADTDRSFTENYPDLSARLFIIRLDDRDIRHSQAAYLDIDQDVSDITLFKFKQTEPGIQYLAHSTTKKLVQKGLRSLTDDGYHLLVMVTYSNFFSPYTSTRPIKLDIAIKSTAAAMSLSSSPDTLDANGTSTSTITATVTDDTGSPVQGETVTFATDSGTLAPATGNTDANGRASVVYTAPNTEPPGGVSNITAAASNSVTAGTVITITPSLSWAGWPAPQWCPQESQEYKGYTNIIHLSDNQAVQCTYHGNARLEWEIPHLNGEKEGWWKDYFESGALESEIYYEAGQRNGTATWFFENGNIHSQATYINDLIEGVYTHYHENGQIEELTPYQSGLKNGMAHWFYDTGARMYDIPWQDGKENGTKKAYYASGPLKYETPYTSGKINGTEKGYYENSQLKYETPYVNDKEQGTRYEYYETGQLKKETPYSDGERHGLEIGYSTDGRISAETPYQNGVYHGQLKYYDASGDLSSCTIYDNGVNMGSCMP